MNNIFHHIQKTNKLKYLAGSFNLNVIDYVSYKKVQCFIYYIFQNNTITIINKPTTVTRTRATALDHMLTNFFVNKTIEKVIIMTAINDNFLLHLVFLLSNPLDKYSQKKEERRS